MLFIALSYLKFVNFDSVHLILKTDQYKKVTFVRI